MLRYIKEAILAPILEYWTIFLGFILLIVGGVFFFQVANISHLTDFLVLILLPIGIICGYFLYRSILETVSENMFGDTFGSLLTILAGIFSVVYIQGKQWNDSQNSNNIVYLILSSLLWITGIHLIFQTYSLGSGKTIKHLIRELRFSERQKLDWLQEGKADYTVEVFKLSRIPYDISSINKDAEAPQKISSVLKKYFSHRRKSDKQRVMILVGSFGTGKSTALVNSVIRQLNNPFHGHSIPIYVKLRDCFKEEYLSDKEELKKAFFDDICKQYNLSSSYSETLYTFHQNRKVVYIFDGVNEILQMTQSDKLPEAEAQSFINFLYSFSAGNDCIISFYPMPGIITSQSLSIDNPNRKYQMYGIYGIAEAEKLKRSSNINKNILDSVALFRMYEMVKKEDKEVKTTYDLIENTLETRLDSLIAGSTTEMDKLEKLVEEYLFNTDNASFATPYSPIPGVKDETYDELCDMRILQEVYDEHDDNSVIGYRFCHILIYEFFVARVILKKLENFKKSDSTGSKIELLLRNSENNAYLEHMHIIETNRLIMEKLDVDRQDILIKCLIPNPSDATQDEETQLKYYAFLLDVGMDASIISSHVGGFLNNIDTICNYKNEKLKIILLELFDVTVLKKIVSGLETAMENWDTSFVALKREFYQKIFSISKKHTNERIVESLNEELYEQYLLEEYIAEIRKTKKNQKETSNEAFKKAFNKRLSEHYGTIILYIAAIILNISQVAMHTYNYFSFDGERAVMPYILIGIAKVVALILCICSMLAYFKQMIYNVEVYGQALSDISATVPISEVLCGFDNSKDSTKWLLVVDWLKNRPSIIIMLIWLLTNLWGPRIILEFIGLGNMTGSMYEWLFVMAVELITFFVVFPKYSSFSFWKKKKAQGKHIVFWEALLILGGIFFIFTGAISILLPPIVCFIVVVIIAALIYISLSVFSWNRIISGNEKDKRIITALHKQVQQDKEDISDTFNKLSSLGQIRFLEWLQSRSQKFNQTIEKIDDKTWIPKSDKVMVQLMNMIKGTTSK